MTALDAMKVPYKYELTQVLTPQLSGSGVVVLDAPKRITVLSKIAILSKSKYDSKQCMCGWVGCWKGMVHVCVLVCGVCGEYVHATYGFS